MFDPEDGDEHKGILEMGLQAYIVSIVIRGESMLVNQSMLN